MEIEDIIGAVLVLLILSLITEKAANVLKLNLNRLAIPQNSLLYETRRTRLIQKRTIVIGIIVSILCKTSLFIIFDPAKKLFWTVEELPTGSGFEPLTFAATIFGCILTGLFLSFGSKFFHDLLDLLLEAKNLKRKLADRANWDFDTIEEVDKYLLTNDSADAKSKIKEALSRFESIEYYKVDYPKRIVYVYASNSKGIGEKMSIDGSLGAALFKIVLVKTDARPILALASIRPGVQIANINPYKGSNYGAAGVIVQNSNATQKYILTCYHAVWNEKTDWDGYANEPACDICSPLQGTTIGRLYLGIKNYNMDIALIKINDATAENALINARKPKAVRSLNQNDVSKGTALAMISKQNTNQFARGYCSDIDYHVWLEYPDGQKRALENLYKIETSDKKPFSVRGDSGSLVIDEFDYAIGLLVGGDEYKTSFAIPLDTILNNYNLKLLL
jgi:hypothetical protein